MQNEKLKMKNALIVTLCFCTHCGRNPGRKLGSDTIWNGFYDSDTCEYVCFACQDAHYAKKRKSSSAGLFSEVPVCIVPDTNTPLNLPSRGELPDVSSGETHQVPVLPDGAVVHTTPGEKANAGVVHDTPAFIPFDFAQGDVVTLAVTCVVSASLVLRFILGVLL